jgi:opacity protein-like surface antigen
MRRCLTQMFVAAVALSLPLPALAQQSKCPPGAWFCGEVDVQVPGVGQARPQIPPQAPPAVDDQDAPPPPPAARRQAPAAQPPVVVYQPVPAQPPPQIIVVTPGYGYGGPYAYRPRPAPIAAPAQPRWQPEFGLNLRVEGAAVGHPNGANYSSGLGGVGLSLRYRPVPHFAFDLGADFLAGTDYNGFSRMEVPISLNGIIYVNPRSRVQFYLIGGMSVSRAQVRSDSPSPILRPVDGGSSYGADYTYFGGQGGAGLEFRLSRRVALDIDGLGFVRRRIDDGREPEFVDPDTGRTTNVSGGGLFRGGINFWW